MLDDDGVGKRGLEFGKRELENIVMEERPSMEGHDECEGYERGEDQDGNE